MATSTTGTVLSGLASGIDWTSLINNLVTIERAPETQWNSQIATLNKKNAAYQTLGSDLSKVQTDISNLTDPSFFRSRTVSSSNPDVASATASSGTPVGNYNFKVTQLATSASITGYSMAAQPVSTGDGSDLSLGSQSFAMPISDGNFTVDGQTISVKSTDTLGSVFAQINSKTGGTVSGAYDSSSDTITLTDKNGDRSRLAVRRTRPISCRPPACSTTKAAR